jgi:hypothetical protein
MPILPSILTSRLKIVSSGGGGGGGTNPSLLLHLDSDFSDSSLNETVIYLSEVEPIITTDEKKFGAASADFSSGQYLFSGNSGDSPIPSLQLGADFTVELWYYPRSLESNQCLYDCSRTGMDSERSDAWALAIDTSGNMFWFHNGGPNYTSSSLSLEEWQHIAVCRSGSTLRVFIQGQNVLELTNSIDFSRGGAIIGTITESLGSYPLDGYIDEVRVIKEAVYTSNFTPPTSPFPNP